MLRGHIVKQHRMHWRLFYFVFVFFLSKRPLQQLGYLVDGSHDWRLTSLYGATLGQSGETMASVSASHIILTYTGDSVKQLKWIKIKQRCSQVAIFFFLILSLQFLSCKFILFTQKTLHLKRFLHHYG